MKLMQYHSAALLMVLSTNLYAASIKLESCPTDKKTISLSGKVNHRLIPNPDATAIDILYFELPSDTSTENLKIDLVETERRSRISQDWDTLKKIASKLLPSQLKSSLTENRCIAHTPAYERSTIDIKIDNNDGDQVASQSFLYGSEERLYLTADMGVTNVRQLSWDQKTSSATEKEKPSSFYIGFNYKFGDTYINYSDQSDFYKNFSLKLLIQASSKPLESSGVGLGYEFPWFSLFAARIWTKDDANVPGKSLGTTQSNLFGISFNLSKGLDWLKSN